MKIKNPTNLDVSIVINGTLYEVSPGGELDGISEEHALVWKKTHGFLVIQEETKKEVKSAEPEVVAKEEPVVIKAKKK